ncbi:MAG: DUF2891 domain-containing protein [Planctomycetota bacterium]|nr:DUF2891 domain-containing protein [Planctomycetota bacterium]
MSSRPVNVCCVVLSFILVAFTTGPFMAGMADDAKNEPLSSEQLKMALTDDQVAAFAALALKGIPQEYPNKPSNVMASPDDVKSPSAMHPVFFGCFDWHSSVHGHWMLARLLKLYPDSSVAAQIRETLNQQLTKEKLQIEADYFLPKENKSFERMYGWAWALQLVAELHNWDDADATRWRENLRPLETVIVQSSMDYLPKLSYPIRTGIHPDTGFSLSLELDYARITGHKALEELIVARAKHFYLKDVNYPAHYEPSGNDFFSSGFNEADLMRRVLPRDEFSKWLDTFLPQLRTNEMGPMMEPVQVSDVTDGHLVHLAGLDLSRAWTMAGIATALPDSDPRKAMLQNSARRHFTAGMAYVTSGHYEGEHWLATFAVYYSTGAFHVR